ncbi:arogenate dehydratase/prephenate dehydratase 1, chloroplastic-like [Cynara cardunculus var. scolymus]|uniref:arogenate dehydratase/prephenate dehydratase 1, chloroplastic-like n=1 Tax=Cynara cardunculus var. scolymus TaxID=59895 RepID=UPI000D629FE7|nr:arogenate dehydratase/prephenate dehydratase 1, chloroplastic-like [Cynara cardunculus var. scolymus]
MSLKVIPLCVSATYPHSQSQSQSQSQLGISYFLQKNHTNLLFRINPAALTAKLGRSKTHVEGSKPAVRPSDFALNSANDDTQIIKDLNSLPKPLSTTDIVSNGSDGSKVRVAYKGAPGAHSEAAALKAYPKCETVPCEEFESVFKQVELSLVDKVVLPIESSIGGSVHRNYDLFLRYKLHIVGEVQLNIDHCLLGLPGVQMEELVCVLSHPQALDQCKIMLNKLNVVKVNTQDTAGAAQIIASKGSRDTGAIASSRAAKIYGLDILSNKIQDDPDNITRFLILAREPIIPGTVKPHKTSIVFTLEEGSGVLVKALAAFALRDINISKIESRPLTKCPLRIVDDGNNGSAKYFDYFFYIDFEASMAEPRAQYALSHLQEFSSFLRVLGCYPVDECS